VQSETGAKDIGLSDRKDCLGYRVIVKSVERIADHAVLIAENVLSLDEKIDESVFRRISEMDSLARSVFDDATKSLYKKDYMLADSVVARAKSVSGMETEIVKAVAKRLDIHKMSSVRMILESIRRTAEYASDIAEIVLNLNVHQIIET